MTDPYPYTCPDCNGDIEADRFGDAEIVCPHCAAGPFVTAHECWQTDEGCEDYLERVTT